MKAILKIGSFTMMTDIPDTRPTWYIIAPTGRPHIDFKSEPIDTVVLGDKRWEFKFKDVLYCDQGDSDNGILLYEFVRQL